MPETASQLQTILLQDLLVDHYSVGSITLQALRIAQ